VHDLFTVESSGIQWKNDEPRITKLVFIGRNLDKEKLASDLRNMNSK